MCVANSARSQMAEGIGKKNLAGIADVCSAGSQPSKVNPLAIQVLKEIGIDISHQKSKSLDSIDKNTIDLVITLCAEEICPIFPGNVKRLHWPLPDPSNPKYSSDEQLKLFRKVRDDLKNRIQNLRDEMKSWKR
ncbi:arsenate reductase ArsC [Aquicella lusitana]|nr:arsenate reductase ArsC [Aquicella lusitana]